MGRPAPTLSVSGTSYTASPVPRAVIFRDADSVADGVGFMVYHDTGGISTGNFYDTRAALANDEPVTLAAIAGETVRNEPQLLGLVRAGSEPITSATLTFRVTYE